MGDFEDVKAAASLKDYADQHLEKGRQRDSYICPKCGSGSGKNKTAGFKIMPDGQRAKCFVCDWAPDIFDLAGEVEHIDEPAERLRAVADWAGVSIGSTRNFSSIDWSNVNSVTTATEKPAEARKGEKGTDTAETDYSAGRERHRRYIAECAERLRKGYAQELEGYEQEAYGAVTAYLSERGITLEDAMEIGMGFDPKPKHGWNDEEGNYHNSPRLVLPWLGCDYYHIDRAIDSRAKDIKYDKPKAEEVGKQPIYNPAAFDQDHFFVVEGVIDAIMLQLCGYNAVALGGTGSNDFATEAASRNYKGVVVEMLDADDRGREAGEKLVALLAEAGITCLARDEYGVGEADTYGGYKDAGEYYAENAEGLSQMLAYVSACASEKGDMLKEAEYRAAMKHLNVRDPARVALDVRDLKGIYEPVPTGIRALDEALGGGVSLGETTFFGAISSYGKTTFAGQVADSIAARGRSVLFVTIEQSAKEIVAKSLSRLVHTMNPNGWNIATASDIMSLRARRSWGAKANDALDRAVEAYTRTIAPNLKVFEGNEQPTVADVRAIARVMAEHDGEAPIVFIDYLQLLAPKSNRDSDKQAADYNVSELRRMARDLNTHVWCISSLNRSSYSGVISLDSFKESGGIEYGADNLLGLQPRGMADRLNEESNADKRKRLAEKIVKENKAKFERDCELVVLKQRNGALPDEPLPLVFKPSAAYFLEPEDQEEAHGIERPRL